MKRRNASRCLAALAAAPLLAAPAVAQSSPVVRWRLASSYPKSLDAVFGTGETVARIVGEATGGRFQIRIFAAGEVVPAFSVLDAVSAGTVECGHTASFFYWGREPAMAFDYTVPFGLTSRQQNAWYLHGGGREIVQEMMGEQGVRSFPCGNFGAQAAGWFRREVRSVADLRGLKMRIGGFSGAVFSKAGGVPQNIPPSEIYPALERGSIDAAEWAGPYDDEKLGLHRVAPFCYFPGWQEGSGQISFYASRPAFDALPAEYKVVLEAACAQAHTLMQARYDHLNPMALRRLIAAGAQFKFFPREMLAALHRATVETLDEHAAKSPRFRQLLESQRPYQRDIVQWFQIAETQFESAVQQLLRSAQ